MTVEQCWQPVPGGSGTYIRSLGRALRPDVDLRGVAARHSGPPPEDWTLDFPVTHLPLPRVALYESWQRLGRPRVERASGPVDVVHATTWAVPPRTVPLVVTVHDLAFLHEPQHFSKRGNGYFRRALEQVRRTADLIITPSRQSAQDCVDVGIPETRIRVIAHGYDPVPVDDEEVAAFRSRTGLHRPYLLWTGTREPRKNLSGLLAAFQLLRSSLDLDLVLVGPVGWGPDLASLAAGEDRVHLLGHLGTRDLHAAYAGAHVFCYPSLREGFGLPVLEALSHGVPVVTSVGTPMADIVQTAGICVDPRDVDALAEGIRLAVHDREALAAAAIPRSRQFSWETAAGQTLAAYTDAMSTGPGTR
jgi:glycosyltransferase involved in cell wall biosynthesis